MIKRLLFTFSIFLVAITTTQAQFQKAEIKIYGLTCSLCSRSVEMALKKVDFIESIDTDLETTLSTITFKDGATVYPEELAKAVDKSGFSVGYIIMTYTFDKEVSGCYMGRDEAISFIDNPSLAAGTYDLIMVEKDMMANKMFKEYKGQLKDNCNSNKRIYYVALADKLMLN